MISLGEPTAVRSIFVDSQSHRNIWSLSNDSAVSSSKLEPYFFVRAENATDWIFSAIFTCLRAIARRWASISARYSRSRNKSHSSIRRTHTHRREIACTFESE